MQPRAKELAPWICLFSVPLLLRIIPELQRGSALHRIALGMSVLTIAPILAAVAVYASMIVAHKRAGYTVMNQFAALRALTVLGFSYIVFSTVIFLVSLSSICTMPVIIGSSMLFVFWHRSVLVRSDSIILLAENRLLQRADIEQISAVEKWPVLDVGLRIKGEERPCTFWINLKHRDEFCALVGCTATKPAKSGSTDNG